VIVDDVAHDVPPGDVEAAAWALGAYWRRYPEGTVHVVVVDPGVGTSRRALVAEADGRLLVGPDNGVLSWALREAWRAGEVRAIEMPSGAEISQTFHGRDVFAPAAARLAGGVAMSALGDPAVGMVRLPWPEPVLSHGHGARGEVVHVDRFGNLITNLRADARRDGDGVASLLAGEQRAPIGRTYGDVASGELVAYVGSRGLWEIAVRDGSAADRIGGRGTVVVLEPG
jgi:S-adenosylmethionine hydrolase